MDWTKIKTEYITSDISQRALAEKYGVAPETINWHSTREDWVRERKKYHNKVKTKSEQKTIKKTVDAEAEVAARKARIRVMIFKKLEDGMEKADPESAAFRRLSQTYKDMLEIEASTNTMSDGMLEDLIKGLQQ